MSAPPTPFPPSHPPLLPFRALLSLPSILGDGGGGGHSRVSCARAHASPSARRRESILHPAPEVVAFKDVF